MCEIQDRVILSNGVIFPSLLGEGIFRFEKKEDGFNKAVYMRMELGSREPIVSHVLFYQDKETMNMTRYDDGVLLYMVSGTEQDILKQLLVTQKKEIQIGFYEKSFLENANKRITYNNQIVYALIDPVIKRMIKYLSKKPVLVQLFELEQLPISPDLNCLITCFPFQNNFNDMWSAFKQENSTDGLNFSPFTKFENNSVYAPLAFIEDAIDCLIAAGFNGNHKYTALKLQFT